MPKRAKPTPSTTARTSAASVEKRITQVGRDLASSFVGVLDAIPGGPHRPQWLARSLGVNTVLTSRILRAAQQQDPLAVAHMIPGPEPLRRLLRAAEKKKVDPVLLRNARGAVDRFERLIDSEAGDRSSLDAIISGWLPDAREKVELLAKQSVFRGISQLLGTACDVQHNTIILHPSAAMPGRVDSLGIVVSRGLRRVRPGPVITYDTVHSSTPMLTVAGEPVEGLRGLLLEQFCTKPLPQLQVSHIGEVAQYTLCGDEVGVQSAVTLVHATLLPGKKELHRSSGEPRRRTTVAFGIGTPVKTLLFDILLHSDVYPGQTPTLSLYRTAGVFNRNQSNRDEDNRDVDRIEVIESIQPLGQGIAKFRSTDNPDHLDMLRHVCAQRQWDGAAMRGYRCRIEYPIYSSEVVMSFDLPPANDAVHTSNPALVKGTSSRLES